uniref:PPM-type phosphatase domain-containing protein n=1 Tax=Brassica oleracea var. oleracea TaxID=109376 RepID=A0A0D3DA85_BRAOL
MANSFIILAELKNRDQSLQGRPIRSPSRSLSNFRYHLLATFDFKILVKMTGLEYVISDATEIVPTRLYMLTYNIDANLIAKNQKKPSETKPPMVHNLSHHFLPRTATEALFSGFSSGTSALAALIFGRHLMVANAADGRAVLCRNGEAIDMYRDHKPIYLP